MNILKVKDGDGNWVGIPALKGDSVGPTDTQVQDAVDDYLDEHPAVSGTFTNAAKNALLALLENAAYTTAYGRGYLETLRRLLAATVSSISAVFTPGTASFYTDDSLDALKQYLAVTATYSDATTEVLESYMYTLSGSLTLGTSTITVNYGGKTDTFQVTVIEHWSFSISDLVKRSGAMVAANAATCKIALATTTDYRRSFLRASGVTSVAIQQSEQIVSQTSNYYPIKVPAGAVSASVSITPNTQYVAAYLYSLTDGVYTGVSSTGDSGYVQGTHTKEFTTAGDNYYLLITTKYNSAGTSYPTEPSGLDITFS